MRCGDRAGSSCQLKRQVETLATFRVEAEEEAEEEEEEEERERGCCFTAKLGVLDIASFFTRSTPYFLPSGNPKHYSAPPEPWTTPKTSCQFFYCNGTRLPTGSGHAREAVLRGGGARNQRCPCGVGGSMRGRGARWEISIRPFRPCRFWNLL